MILTKVICFLFGHRWIYWKKDDEATDYRLCERCGRWQKVTGPKYEILRRWVNVEKPRDTTT